MEFSERLKNLRKQAHLTQVDVAEKLGIDPQFPSVHQVKTTQLESTGQILEYVESYKRGDFYKIKFIASDKSR